MSDDIARKSIQLDKPLLVNGKLLDTLELNEPTAHQVWMASAYTQSRSDAESNTLFSRSVIAAAAGLQDKDLADLKITKFAEATEWLEPLLEIPEAVQNPASQEVISFPSVEHAGRSYDSLSLEEPTTDQVRKAQGHLRNGLGAQSLRFLQMHLVANVSGVPFEVIKKLPISKLNAAYAYLTGFSRPGPGTGGI
jgi:hypothetical protein